jgi:hypothetical protein
LKRIFLSIVVAVAAPSVFTGCALPDAKARDAAAWSVPSSEIPQGDWTMLPPSRSAWVRDADLDAAAARLDAAPFVEIEPSAALALSRPQDDLEAGSPLRAFLVRGVAFGAPTYAAVQVSAAGTRLWLHQASAHAEMLGAYSGPLRKCPMIVLLERPPERVFPTAFTGGDSALRGSAGAKWFRR